MNNDLKFTAQYFGAFEFRSGDVAINRQTLRSYQVAKLLAILIFYQSAPVSQTTMIDLLWPEDTEDPSHALANLIYRLKKALAAKWPDRELILNRGGVYQWNPEYPVENDRSIFIHLYEQAETCIEQTEKMRLLEQMTDQYTGKYLADFSDDLSILSRQSYYHNLYLKAVETLLNYYEQTHNYTAMEALCHRALDTDPLEEMFHCGILKAYIATNRFVTAEDYYRETSSLLIQRNGGVPAEQLASLYERMQIQIHSRETDLRQIMEDMAEEKKERRAFYCEYGFFRTIYILLNRMKERADIPVSMILISLYVTGEDVPGEKTEAAMYQMKEVLLSSLRQGDAVTKYSASQYLLMLSGCNQSQCEIVMQRITDKFKEQFMYRRIQLQYSTREL